MSFPLCSLAASDARKRKRPVLIADGSSELIKPVQKPTLKHRVDGEAQKRVSARARSVIRLPTVVECRTPSEGGSGTASPTEGSDEAGRLYTVGTSGRKRALVIKLSQAPLTIGRSIDADYSVQDALVSGFHCSVYGILCDTGERLACVCDTSTNGFLWNDQLVQRRTVILSDGDEITVGPTAFKYLHRAPAGDWHHVGSQPKADAVAFRPRMLGRYLLTDRILGSGFFSVVHLAIDVDSRRQTAVKVMRKKRARSAESHAALLRECQINAKLSHVNIARIYDLKEDDTSWYLILELVTGGDLFSYIQRLGHLEGAESKFIAYQVLRGLEYMHDTANVAHRDLKPENLLLAGRGPYPRVMIADFGACQPADVACTSISGGTLSYLSPEALNVVAKGPYSAPIADMWAFGVCAFIMLHGYHPFDCNTNETPGPDDSTTLAGLGYSIPSSDIDVVRKVLSSIPPVSCFAGASDRHSNGFLAHLIDPDPSTRMTASQALSHDWLARSRTDLETLYVKVVTV